MKDNIAVVVILEFKDTKQRIIVANTHIHWNPEYSDVKLIQTQIFLEELTKIREKYKALQNNIDLPMIVCGDFNSTPDSGKKIIFCFLFYFYFYFYFLFLFLFLFFILLFMLFFFKIKVFMN